MIAVLTHHWTKTGKLYDGRRLLERNGLAQSRVRGFVNRRTFYSMPDPTKITTVVLWESNDIYDLWKNSPERVEAMAGSEELWSKLPESEKFEVGKEVLSSIY